MSAAHTSSPFFAAKVSAILSLSLETTPAYVVNKEINKIRFRRHKRASRADDLAWHTKYAGPFRNSFPPLQYSVAHHSVLERRKTSVEEKA
jgi:hypothetical protein